MKVASFAIGLLTTVSAAETWVTISTTAACQANHDGIKNATIRSFGRSNLEACKQRCLDDYRCVAIDFWDRQIHSKYCTLRDSACTQPFATWNGGSSYSLVRDPSVPMPTQTAALSPEPEKIWHAISETAACQQNDQGIGVREWGGTASEAACKSKCEADSWCVAIDFYWWTGHCNRYDVACKNPKAGHHGASSFRIFRDPQIIVSPSTVSINERLSAGAEVSVSLSTRPSEPVTVWFDNSGGFTDTYPTGTYTDLGAGKCMEAESTYLQGINPASCRADCTQNASCGGYSTSSSGDCILWFTPFVAAGGDSWEGAKCMSKDRAIRTTTGAGREDGFCVTSTGLDQNAGVVKLDGENGSTENRWNECRAKCLQVPDATGCELIWSQHNRGCYVHTKEIDRGNGVARHYCEVFGEPRNFGTTLWLSKCSVTFNSVNWNRPQTVSLRPAPGHSNIAFTTNLPVFATDTNDSDYVDLSGLIVVKQTRKSLGICSSYGDPHFTSFDGTAFSSYEIGDYNLAKSHSANLVIQARHNKCGRRASCNTGVAVKYLSSVVSIVINQETGIPKISVLSESLINGFKILSESSNKYMIYLPDGTRVGIKLYSWSGTHLMDTTVWLSGCHYDNVGGLCGSWDDNRSNDINMSLHNHARSNKVDSSHSLFYYPETQFDIVNTDQDALPTVFVPQTCDQGIGNDSVEGTIPTTDPGDDGPTDITDTIISATPEDNEPVRKELFDDDFEPLDPDADPEFETDEEKNEAEETCSNLYLTSDLATACGIDTSKFYDSCVFDAAVVGDLTTATLGLDALEAQCRELVVVEEQENFEDDPTTPSDPPPASDVLQKSCPSACSLRGTCVNGSCQCEAPWTTEDCSVDSSKDPELFCDSQEFIVAGKSFSFKGKHLTGADVTCHFGNTAVIAEILNDFMGRCTVPNLPASLLNTQIPVEIRSAQGDQRPICPVTSTLGATTGDYSVVILDNTIVRCKPGNYCESADPTTCKLKWRGRNDAMASLLGSKNGVVYARSKSREIFAFNDNVWTAISGVAYANLLPLDPAITSPATVTSDQLKWEVTDADLQCDGGGSLKYHWVWDCDCQDGY